VRAGLVQDFRGPERRASLEKTVSDSVKFEAHLLAHLGLSATDFQQRLDEIRFYREQIRRPPGRI
jgi:hypothetical protein